MKNYPPPANDEGSALAGYVDRAIEAVLDRDKVTSGRLGLRLIVDGTILIAIASATSHVDLLKASLICLVGAANFVVGARKVDAALSPARISES